MWLPLGIATKNYAFSIVGLVFAIVGLVNKSKWRDEKDWSDLSPSKRKFKLTLMIFLSALLVFGVVLFILTNS